MILTLAMIYGLTVAALTNKVGWLNWTVVCFGIVLAAFSAPSVAAYWGVAP